MATQLLSKLKTSDVVGTIRYLARRYRTSDREAVNDLPWREQNYFTAEYHPTLLRLSIVNTVPESHRQRVFNAMVRQQLSGLAFLLNNGCHVSLHEEAYLDELEVQLARVDWRLAVYAANAYQPNVVGTRRKRGRPRSNRIAS